MNTTALDVARSYVELGWNPVPIPFRTKKPDDDEWQHRVIGRDNVADFFNGTPMNVGIVLGPTSKGLVDIDLDCAEAIFIAPVVLPPTRAIFGRASKRASHRLYYHATLAATLGKAALQLKDPINKRVLVAIRVGGSKGAQTIVPGSTHETGEPIKWDEEGEPAQAGDELVHLAKVVGALSLMTRYWPQGSRHDAALTAGGFLARCGLKLPMVKAYVEFVARAAGDEEVRDRIKAAEDATTAHQAGEKTRGYPALKEAFGADVAARIADWFDYSGSRDDDAGASSTPSEPIVAVPYCWKDPETIPARQWVYGRRLMRKLVSATVAAGGIGKTSLEIAEALTMVSGKALLGITPPQLLSVWLWNLEDPREETERQIQATAKYYGLTPADLGNRLYVNCARERPLVIAATIRDKAIIVRPVVDSLLGEINRLAIDVLIIDPFVSCHQIAENDNSAIDMVAKEWGRVADLGNCAVELVHHVRKGEDEITAESSRGGGALIDACRTVQIINRMTKEQADQVGLSNHRLYFRTFNDKANKVPPADQSDWYKLTSVDLCNGVPGESDLIGVVRKWMWPDALAGMTAADFDKVAAVIRGARWRESIQAKAWVGYAVARALGLNADNKKDRARIIGMLKRWFAEGSLIKVEGEDEHRMPRWFVDVRET